VDFAIQPFVTLAQEAGGFNPLLSLAGMAIGAVVGYLIGNRKGRGVLGAVLGGLLGCIGWIIVAVIPAADGTPKA